MTDKQDIPWSVEELRTAVNSTVKLDNEYSRFLLSGALAEIERLEAGPCHRTCVYEPVQGYPHESGCIGCRIEKHCYKCGHFVDLLSKHR